jgi:hypothetical protein
MSDAQPLRRTRILAVLSSAALLVSTLGTIARADDTRDSGPVGTPAALQTVSVTAAHRNGQTFLTWPALPGTGWTYRIYRSSSVITTSADLVRATLVTTVGDSSAYDRRLSVLLGQAFGYSIDSLAAPLNPASGLAVVTAPGSGARFYAVTTQHVADPENRAISPGANSLTSAVNEVARQPRPVYQRDITWAAFHPSVYTLWTSRSDSPVFPAMSSREGMAFDFGVTRGFNSALLIHPHARMGSFLDGVGGFAGEWVLAPDDPLPNGENTFWFGYHPGYDIDHAATPPPTSGTVVDYTYRRVSFMLDWALANLPVDPACVYAFGYSMGGIGSLELAFWAPRRIAAVMAVIGKFDFSWLSEPDAQSWFNPNGPGRQITDRMWGTVSTNLSSTAGVPTFQRTDLTWLASHWGGAPLPPIIAINGKRDNVTGWAEKIPFYDAMRARRLGGSFFWSPEDHYGTHLWTPMVDPAYIFRYRSDLSYPALSNCSLDSNPGNGTFASGDTIGTINGYLEWDSAITDVPTQWSVKLSMRGLRMSTGTLSAPESCVVDVTPARLQKFIPGDGGDVVYTVTRVSDNAVVQTGLANPGPTGIVTIPAVKVFRTGSVLSLVNSQRLAVDPPRAARLALGISANPARGTTMAMVTWPSTQSGVLDVVDVAGRQRAHLVQVAGTAGPARVSLDLRVLPPGLYFVRAASGNERVTRRLTVLD